MHICVLGGGVIGVATAYHLARQGCQVTLIDQAASLAQGASFANGSQLSYSYVAPFASPSTLRHLPGWLLQRNGPLRIRPDLNPAQWRWCLDFLQACTAEQSEQTTADLLELGAYSRDTLHEMLGHDGIDFSYTRSGKLVVYRDRGDFQSALRQMDIQARLGSQQEAFDGPGCVLREPALAGLGPHLVGGIYTASEETGDCQLFTAALGAVAEQRYGVRMLFNHQIRALRAEAGRLVGVETSEGVIEADGFVLALGTGGPKLLAPLGIKLPVYPLTGYSLTAPTQGRNSTPRISITDLHHKIVYAPLGDRLRVAGMVDLGEVSARTIAQRTRLLTQQARETLPDAADYDQSLEWCGHRPATPDSKPILGGTRYRNLWLNTGHGALGFTFACGSARLIADSIAGHAPALSLTPFSASPARHARNSRRERSLAPASPLGAA